MLKLSGEALEGKLDFGIDPLVLRTVAKEVAIAARQGVEIAIVVGGGNFFRGVNRWKGLERTTADYVGMLATVMNAITLQNAIEQEGLEVRVQTAIEMREVAEPYIRRRAIRHLERGRVVIFGAGTGNPFFTTDTAAALRAAEIGAEVYLKATQVDGIYDCDPRQNPSARKYTHISYRKCVMDDIKVRFGQLTDRQCLWLHGRDAHGCASQHTCYIFNFKHRRHKRSMQFDILHVVWLDRDGGS